VETMTASTTDGPRVQQILTFLLGQGLYGVNILRVREIRGWTPVTSIPNSPSHMLGVLNLRGSIVPTFDLRMQFSLQQASYTKMSVVVILSIDSSSGRRELGVVVDAVSDVVSVNEAELRPVPQFDMGPDADLILGLVPVGDRMVVLLEIDRLLGGQPGGGAAAVLSGRATRSSRQGQEPQKSPSPCLLVQE
jgi:purine-binding chemotaxis protein CheW